MEKTGDRGNENIIALESFTRESESVPGREERGGYRSKVSAQS